MSGSWRLLGRSLTSNHRVSIGACSLARFTRTSLGFSARCCNVPPSADAILADTSSSAFGSDFGNEEELDCAKGGGSSSRIVDELLLLLLLLLPSSIVCRILAAHAQQR
jgi:hypothetical protein